MPLCGEDTAVTSSQVVAVTLQQGRFCPLLFGAAVTLGAATAFCLRGAQAANPSQVADAQQ